MAKFARLQVWKIGRIYKLCSLLHRITRRSSRGKSKVHFEAPNPEAIVLPSQRVKKYDPYSINMQTTHASDTQLAPNNQEVRVETIDLGGAANWRARPEISFCGSYGQRFEEQGIRITWSVEQHENKVTSNASEIV